MSIASQLVLCPHCNKNVTNDGSLSGRTVQCPHCPGQFQMPHLSPVQTVPSVRCYDCGQQIPLTHIVRRDVTVSQNTSLGRYGGWNLFGLNFNSARVDLCIPCNQRRTEAIRQMWMWIGIIVGGLILLGYIGQMLPK